MAALTKDRNTPRHGGETFGYGVAASTRIFAGSIAALNAAGDAVPGATSTTLTAVGRADTHVDNSAGAAGDETVIVRKGVFQFANSAAADEITKADIGADCFIVDDQTVAKTNGTNTRSVAGKVMAVDPQGVWVKFD